MNTTRKKTQSKAELFPLEKVSFYFDEVERDRLDSIGSSGRTVDVMQIRNQLLTLPDGQFLPTLKAIKSILQGSSHAPESGSKDKKNPKLKSTTQPKQGGPAAPWLESSESSAGLSSDDDPAEPPAAVVKILHSSDQSDSDPSES